jgi:hypothetical protein
MTKIKLIAVSILLLVMFIQCTKEPDTPTANFVIEKDTILDGKKQRVEVDNIYLKDQIYFVSKTNAMFNAIWPGDSVKVGKLMVYQDYNLNKSIVNLVMNKADSLMQMKSNQYQGFPLPSGTLEYAYKFKSKGMLTVTWISTNSTAEKSKTSILQKTITVQ